MRFEDRIGSRLDELKHAGQYRIFAELSRTRGHLPRVWWNGPEGRRQVVHWCSNDYLGMGHHPAVIQAMQQALADGATGAGGTRNIGGTNELHVELEHQLARLHGKPAALSFTSGYSANLASLSVLGSLLPDTVILSDAQNHNSMIEGIRRSGARKIVFAHNDVADLEAKLSALAPEVPKIVAFESVYSMSGSVAPIGDIARLCARHGAISYLDEVHAVGLYGDTGAGMAAEQGVADQIDLVQGTLGKAFGLQGGYIAGSHLLVDAVRSFGQSFIFSTALAPVLAAGALASIRHLMTSQQERRSHRARVAETKARLASAGVASLENDSHIVPVMVGDAAKAKEATDILLKRDGIYLQPINYPTVPRGRERIRIVPGPHHDSAMIEQLVSAVDRCWSELGLRDTVGA